MIEDQPKNAEQLLVDIMESAPRNVWETFALAAFTAGYSCGKYGAIVMREDVDENFNKEVNAFFDPFCEKLPEVMMVSVLLYIQDRDSAN